MTARRRSLGVYWPTAIAILGWLVAIGAAIWKGWSVLR